MIQKLIQTSYFYTLSIGLHVAILFSLMLSVNIKPSIVPPVISASVYFETPKKVVIKKKPLKKVVIKKIPLKKITVSTKKQKKVKTLPPIVKPKLKAINSQNYPANDIVTENLNLTSGNPLNLKGFLRANQLTQKQKPAQNTNLKGNSSTLINKSTKVTQKYKANLLAKNSDAPPQQEPAKKSDKKLVVEQTIESNQYADLLAEYDVDEHENTILATKWSKRTEKKVFQKSLFFQISEHWVLPPVALSDFQVIVSVLMTNKGQIKKIDFIEYAPVAIINIAVERTLRRAEPFENVPDSMLQPNGEYKTVFKFTANQVAN